MIIRPETADDYAAIADVTARAFGRAAEAIFVDLHRHRSASDPELSLVAEVEGDVIGHALFSPRTIRLMDADVHVAAAMAIELAPSPLGEYFARIDAGTRPHGRVIRPVEFDL